MGIENGSGLGFNGDHDLIPSSDENIRFNWNQRTNNSS